MTAPKATTWLNYKGDHRGSVGRVMGPNLLNEYLTVVEANYDAAAGTSRLGLAYGVHKLEES
jgi:hypothetical protein